MSEVDYKENVHRCFRCGFCKLSYDYNDIGFNCPMYHRFRLETYSPGGLNWLIRAALITDTIKWSEHLSEILYSCSTCGNCAEACRFDFGEHLVDYFIAVREQILETRQPVPKMVRKFLENVYLYGNPYREARETRADWAQGLGIKPFQRGDEYLYYVGCVGSYDTCSQRAAKALCEVMQKAGVSFGILGEAEECEGNEVRLLGEMGLFEHQRETNLATFKERGVQKIITLSPHSYNAFKNYYEGDFEVFHYTQILRDLIGSRALSFSGRFDAAVTYHDPCFLGRHNKEYDAPREILNTVPGLQLVEMERNRQNAFCCGGGSGNFYTGLSAKGMDQASHARIWEAYRTGARVLAVACPVCLLMLEDALKGEGLDEQMQVKDISEIVLESM